MRILRLLVVGSVFGGSLLAIGFTCVDRLSHPAPGPVPTLVRAGLPEPAATGSLPSDDGAVFGPNAPEPGRSAAIPAPKPAPAKAAAKPPVKKAAEGFDTERLNALMRGDPSVTLSRTR